jgi:hypothetical protein
MEPRKTEKPVESRGEDQTLPPRQEEKKRRFRIIKLEERIAPGKGSTFPYGGKCLTNVEGAPCHA